MTLPAPRDLQERVPVLIDELVAHLGERAVVEICLDLLGGADRASYVGELAYLTGLRFETGAATLDPRSWKDFWVRSWGARGLLYVWRTDASPAVVRGVGDEAWRPAEMCLRVAARRELGEAGPGAARLVGHRLPRVRAQALRTLGGVGDTEHVEVVRRAQDDEHPDVRRSAARALDAMAERLGL